MYAQIAQSYDALHAQEQERKLQALLEEITLPAYATVADIGCATAHLHPYFSDLEYLGVDPCQELLKQAPSHVQTLCASGEDLPLENDSHQLTLSLTALHNYDDPVRGVAELARITRNTALIGVLKKSDNQAIISAIHEHFLIASEREDKHDYLYVGIPRRRKR